MVSLMGVLLGGRLSLCVYPRYKLYKWRVGGVGRLLLRHAWSPATFISRGWGGQHLICEHLQGKSCHCDFRITA